jgi:trehalose utilization protein
MVIEGVSLLVLHLKFHFSKAQNDLSDNNCELTIWQLEL